MDVVVLGGGPAGLAAAWRAARAGRSVLLLERAPAVGGMAASFEVAGVRVDTGSHRLHPATPRAGAGPAARAARRRPADPAAQRPAAACTTAGSASRCAPAELARTLPPTAVLRIGRDAATRPFTRPDPTLVRVAAGQHARPGALQRALRAVRGEAVGAARPGHRRRAGPPPGQRRRRLGHRPHAGPAGTGPGRGGCSTTRAAASARSSTCSPRPPARPARRSRPAPR